MPSHMSIVAVCAVILSGLVFVSACNTVSGVGKDVSAVGDATTDAAEDAKK